MLFILFMAMILPPMNTGWVSINEAANILRLSVWNASTIPLPTPLSIPASTSVLGSPICANTCPAAVPILPRACFCSSLRMDTCLLVYIYAPEAFIWGRYLVRADFLILRAISRLTRATPICLLLRSAIERQLSNDRAFWASASSE